MIQIKNKRMILFPEDRLIGASGDVNSTQRVFILDKIQDDFDLSECVAWIKIDPKASGGAAYEQMLKTQVDGEKIFLTWQLTAKNMEAAGEISAQIIFASPDYFDASELESLSPDDLVVPSKIKGSSAPVWQSYCETFIIERSIDSSAAYSETTKNILVSAVADAANSARLASEYAEDILAQIPSVKEYSEISKNAASLAESYCENSEQIKADTQALKEFVEQSVENSENICMETQQFAEDYRYACLDNLMAMEGILENTKNYSIGAHSALSKIKKAENFRLLYSKTLTSEDTDCYSFEITQDQSGKSFNLSEFVVFLYVPAMPEAGINYLIIEAQGKGNTDAGERHYTTLAQFQGINKTQKVYTRMECQNRGRWICKSHKASSWFSNIENGYMNTSVCTNSRYIDGKPAEAIRLIQNASVGVPFPEGMLIEVWGIDAIE